MNLLGQFCLLAAFVGAGYAAFACIAGARWDHGAIRRSGSLAAVAAVAALSGVTGVLLWALLAKDFGFAYVAEYSSKLLPWHYSLSALWVGQAGSLLLWAWLLGVLAMIYRFWPRREPSPLRHTTFGILMAYLCFLVATMVFAADPMEPSVGTIREGAGLSPLLQHPAMLLHPPVVFLAYAAWAVPFALAMAGLMDSRSGVGWVREARSWALFAWGVLGAGIIIGGLWAYEELGWGGYWAWDPVENGSLIPWLTGTALIHAMMAWRYRGALKKTAVSLAIATFALCNFATFLTRSGLFSSLHAFSESSIGWMFLGLMGVLVLGGGILLIRRRKGLLAEKPIPSLWARESLLVISIVALLLLALATTVGTIMAPLSDIFFGRPIVVGLSFYNNVLIPTGLLLLLTTAAAPLLRWGTTPGRGRKNTLFLSAVAGIVAAAIAFAVGVRHPVGLAVAGLATMAAVALAAALVLDALGRDPQAPRRGLLGLVISKRRQYSGFAIHMGFVCIAVGIAGSSLGTHRHQVVMSEGETVQWCGHSIHFVKLIERELPGKLVAETQLRISRGGADPFTLLPAQHLHRLQDQWTTEVAIHSTWAGDFYAVFNQNKGQNKASLTFVNNPMMRWLWFGGWVIGTGALVGLWPLRRRTPRQSVVPPPKLQNVFQAAAAAKTSGVSN